MSPQLYKHDVLIIGSGAAGLTLALHLAQTTRVAILSKSSLTEANTFYAQGGVAAVLSKDDSNEHHIADTLRAGADLCHEEAVRYTVEHGPAAIQWLIDQGVAFTKSASSSDFHLTREGGHSHRRVIHAADATGIAISNTLIQRVKEHPNIDLFENRVAIDLITSAKIGLPGKQCLGAYVLNLSDDASTGYGHPIEVFQTGATVLATGGASKAYLYTSNPDVATGDGIAMAWRAGCRVANMEFNQFHPTCLYHPNARSFLITEAVRGEGGKLILPNGEAFMHRFDERLELAPRDIVARAIDHEMKRLGLDCVYLDISMKSERFIKSHFPTIYEQCLKLGIDICKRPIPVVPAAHYTCGGVVTDLNGATDVASLYAIGETAFTGLHGANRMASNSLLECLVFAMSASKHINQKASHSIPDIELPPWDESQVTNSDEDVIISHNWEELRRFMWDYVGIVRTDKRLKRAKHRVDLLSQEILEFYSNYKISNDLIELRNLVLIADLIICCALQRKESRGLHYNLDYPDQLAEAKDSILTPFNAF